MKILINKDIFDNRFILRKDTGKHVCISIKSVEIAEEFLRLSDLFGYLTHFQKQYLKAEDLINFFITIDPHGTDYGRNMIYKRVGTYIGDDEVVEVYDTLYNLPEEFYETQFSTEFLRINVFDIVLDGVEGDDISFVVYGNHWNSLTLMDQKHFIEFQMIHRLDTSKFDITSYDWNVEEDESINGEELSQEDLEGIYPSEFIQGF